MGRSIVPSGEKLVPGDWVARASNAAGVSILQLVDTVDLADSATGRGAPAHRGAEPEPGQDDT